MSRAREVRTKDARRVLAETRITRPILSSIRKALHQKYYNLHKRDPNAEALRVWTEQSEALAVVMTLLDSMETNAFEALRADLKRDILADLHAQTAPEVVS